MGVEADHIPQHVMDEYDADMPFDMVEAFAKVQVHEGTATDHEKVIVWAARALRHLAYELAEQRGKTMGAREFEDQMRRAEAQRAQMAQHAQIEINKAAMSSSAIPAITTTDSTSLTQDHIKDAMGLLLSPKEMV